MIKRLYADMVSDLFHRGHVEFLKKMRGLYENTYVIIGINSEEDVIGYKRKPVFSVDDRAEIIRSCRYVDEVIIDPPFYITEDFLNKYNIDVVVHGDDMTEYLKKYNYKVPISRGIMETVPYYNGVSTTEIINIIKKGY